MYRRQPFFKRPEIQQAGNLPSEDEDDYGDDSEEGEEAWRNSEGERLADFGVEEEVDFYDEEIIPLAQLIASRQRAKGA